MAISIKPFDVSRSAAIADLNRRMAAGGSSWQFPEHPEPEAFAREEGSPVFQELLVAVDGAAVRGGYTLQHRTAAFRDEERPIGSWYQPISEGSVDPKHSLVAIQLLRDAFRREPLCFGLGLEGLDSQLSKTARRPRVVVRTNQPSGAGPRAATPAGLTVVRLRPRCAACRPQPLLAVAAIA